MQDNVRRLLLVFMLSLALGRIGAGSAFGGEEVSHATSAPTLDRALKDVFALNEAEWRLGECFLGFTDFREPGILGAFVVGYWINNDDGGSTWLIRLSKAESGAQMLALRLLQPVYTDSVLERQARSGTLDCIELEAQRGKLFEVWVVPSGKVAKLVDELFEALMGVQAPVAQAFVLHADWVKLFASSGGGLETVFISLSPPSPSLSRWLHRFRKVILKDGVKKLFQEKAGSGGFRP